MDDLDLYEIEYLRSLASQKLDKGNIQKDTLICECNCISAGEIISSGIVPGKNLKEELKNLGLGSGCASCLKNLDLIKSLIER